MAKGILLEGLDGSGKSSQIGLLKDYLESKGQKVLTLREPGGSAYYEAIREHIHFSDFERPPLSDLLTCAGGIAENIAQTRRALSEGTWVITDRSFISNIVYQVAQGLDPETAENITLRSLDGFEYDIKVLLDISVDLAYERMQKVSRKRDHWESKGREYFERAHELYAEYAKKHQMKTIDGSKSIDEIQFELQTILGV